MTVAYDHAPRYVFPRVDYALLELPGTTVEMLAGQLRDALQAAGARGLTEMEMEVEENFGQSATYRVAL